MTRPFSPGASRPARFVPRVEALEDRRVPTCNFIVQGSTLLVQAPVTRSQPNNNIVISDNGSGGANNVVGFCKQPFFPNVAISRIELNAGGGNDRVTYNLIGDLVTSRVLDANLGNGSNTFQAVLRRNILSGGSLSLNVQGGSGTDHLSAVVIGSLAANTQLRVSFNGLGGDNVLDVAFAHFVNVAAGASIGLGLFGGGGSDRISMAYQGVMSGTFTSNATGGRRSNVISQDIELQGGSTGTVGPSSIRGGPQPDRLQFIVHNPGTASANQNTIFGGRFDDCFRTTNVVVTACGTDHVVP
jgi:hypothetical protein